MLSGWLILKTVGALAVVLGMLLLIMYALRRWGNLSGRPVSRAMEVLARQSFGPRHHLIMVKVSGERNVLVGISPQNMSFLCLSDPAAQGGKPPADTGETI